MHALFVIMRDPNRQTPLTWRVYGNVCDEEAVLAAGWLLSLPLKIFPSPFEAIEAQNLVSMVLVLMYHGVSDFTACVYFDTSSRLQCLCLRKVVSFPSILANTRAPASHTSQRERPRSSI